MLETVNRPQALAREDYKRRLPDLQRRLLDLQRVTHTGGIGSLIVFEGWRTSGQASAIKKVTERLEPRGFTLHSIQEPRTYESRLPWMWRFWCRIPRRGEMAIFHRSWYSELVEQRLKESIDRARWLRKCRDIRFFEDALANDRCLVIKLFLHISREEQRRRLDKIASNPDTEWLLAEDEWERHELYDSRRTVIEETLQQTEAEWGSWSLINTTDRNWARIRVFETLIREMEEGLERFGVSIEDSEV
ncbi:MAG: hypothetical protein K0U98_00485 [Deltaproteobacteria bacterium]|nr:hypothetical protein [Deltaproteobacteria bacterium]